ncbi:hypothetical protein [Streptomyces sp. KHY 26]|uniref:hypothetical protein n=1 Tax=Streptomyces sp. KHY 26 TaxID=3097359 RepID=UPI00376EE4BD
MPEQQAARTPLPQPTRPHPPAGAGRRTERMDHDDEQPLHHRPHGPAAAAADPTPPTVPATPAQRRTPPDGYRRAIEAHRQAARPSTVDPAVAEAVERQTAAMRELSRRAFPEPDVVPDDTPASIEAARAQRRGEAAASEAAALRRARAERAARHTAQQTAVPQQPAALRTTA